ncbi:MAG: isopentenyl phosphate kinase family protein [Candidatus Aenigmarchaeota archaeon]|nr:isopentenyl phosphate kinase family protein [Candidatus Aenigmarchaeota archaeon]
MMEKIILKIGGSVLTKKEELTPVVNKENLQSIAKQIGDFYRKNKDTVRLIIVHGAGSYGHQIVHKTGIQNGIKREVQLVDFAQTQLLQNELNLIVTKILIERGIPAMPVQASAMAVMKNKKLSRMGSDGIEGLVNIGMVPVLYGVPAFDEVQKCSILSGDEIAPYLAKKLKFDKIIHATNVNGIFTSNPFEDEKAKLIKRISKSNYEKIKKGISGSNAVDVTGGMFRKVTELMEIADCGVKSQIVSALVEGNVKKALEGDESMGTIVEE